MLDGALHDHRQEGAESFQMVIPAVTIEP